jgi:hypothetical protein
MLQARARSCRLDFGWLMMLFQKHIALPLPVLPLTTARWAAKATRCGVHTTLQSPHDSLESTRLWTKRILLAFFLAFERGRLKSAYQQWSLRYTQTPTHTWCLVLDASSALQVKI